MTELNLDKKDAFPDSRNGNGLGKPSVEYDYVDEKGSLLYQVVRFEPKIFRQRKPDGRDGWDWNLNGTRRVLYNLPAVLKAVEVGKPVFLVEGEKDADALIGLSLTATTNPMGAGKWLDEYNESLLGARVVIIPDNDKPGR